MSGDLRSEPHPITGITIPINPDGTTDWPRFASELLGRTQVHEEIKMADTSNFAAMNSRDHMVAAEKALSNITGAEIRMNPIQFAQLHLLAALVKAVSELAETIASKE